MLVAFVLFTQISMRSEKLGFAYLGIFCIALADNFNKYKSMLLSQNTKQSALIVFKALCFGGVYTLAVELLTKQCIFNTELTEVRTGFLFCRWGRLFHIVMRLFYDFRFFRVICYNCFSSSFCIKQIHFASIRIT